MESEKYNRKLRKPYSIQCYAISVNEDIEQLKLSVRFPNSKRPLLGIARGYMEGKYGPAEENRRYLFMTYDSCEGRYVYSKVSDETLIKMLQAEIPIEQVYRDASEIFMTEWSENGFISERHEAKSFQADLQ